MPPDDHPGASRLVVVGESLVDVVVDESGDSTSAPGGSPMNVAVGLARLGVPTLLVTQVADDPHGHMIVDHVRDSGAALSRSSPRQGDRTSTAVAHIGAGKAARYDFDIRWDLPAQDLPATSGLHVGSLGATLLPGRDTVLAMVRQAAARGLFVSYDPNERPALLEDPESAWRDVTELASLSTLVKVSEEDLEALRPIESVTDLARELLSGSRTELVILTRGAASTLGFGQDLAVEVSAAPVELVDTVGAGDSFMAAALAVLWEWGVLGSPGGGLASLDEDRLRELLSAAAIAASVTCGRRGADPPWHSELPPEWP